MSDSPFFVNANKMFVRFDKLEVGHDYVSFFYRDTLVAKIPAEPRAANEVLTLDKFDATMEIIKTV